MLVFMCWIFFSCIAKAAVAATHAPRGSKETAPVPHFSGRLKVQGPHSNPKPNSHEECVNGTKHAPSLAAIVIEGPLVYDTQSFRVRIRAPLQTEDLSHAIVLVVKNEVAKYAPEEKVDIGNLLRRVRKAVARLRCVTLPCRTRFTQLIPCSPYRLAATQSYCLGI